MKYHVVKKLMGTTAALVLIASFMTGCSQAKSLPNWWFAFLSDPVTITEFSFLSADNPGLSSDVTGIISGSNISLTVPFGTEISTLIATFISAGESITVLDDPQISGETENDYTGPVTYTVTAAKGGTAEYLVTVIVAPDTAKEITAFGFPSASATGIIDGTNISVTVPYDTDVTALVATFNTTGASITVGPAAQTSGETANDFTNPVTYRVTAADSSYQDYTVTVTIALNTAKNITAFSIPSAPATGIIDGLNISVTVPYGTDVTALVATFSTTGASVKVGETTQVSAGTPNDFTEPVTYRVTAANSSHQDYTVTVAIALSPAKNITAFSIPSAPATGVISGLNISVTVPYGTNVTDLVATFSTTGASVKVGETIQISEGTPNDFTEPVTYRVTAADSSYQDYVVTVTIALNPAKEITAFSIPSAPATGVIDGLNISMTVPYGTNVTALVATFSTTGASVKVGETTQVSAGTPNDFTEPVTYRVTAANSSHQDYIVTVAVALNPAMEITAFSIPSAGATGYISGSSISVTVPGGTDVNALVATFSTTGAFVMVGSTTQTSGGTPNDFTEPVTYRVTAADSSYRDYIVTVTISSNSEKSMTEFGFPSAGAAGIISEMNGTIAVTVPYGTSVTALVATFVSTGASVKVNSVIQTSGGTPNNFSSPLVYTAYAGNGSTKDYTVTVTIASNTAKNITAFSFLSVNNPGISTDVSGTIDASDISVALPFGTDVSSLKATFSTSGASVTVGGVLQVSDVTAHDFTSPVIYTVHAGDSSTKPYTVTIYLARGVENFTIRSQDYETIITETPTTMSGSSSDGIVRANGLLSEGIPGTISVSVTVNGIESPMADNVSTGGEFSGDIVLNNGMNAICIVVYSNGTVYGRSQVVTIDSSIPASVSRLELRWDGPGDLDFHLQSYSPVFHVYYGDLGYTQDGYDVQLDVDNTSGYGPENIRVYTVDAPTTVTCFVNYYSGDQDLNVTVRSFNIANELVNTYTHTFLAGDVGSDWIVDTYVVNP